MEQTPRSAAFTLIELLIVVAIISILAAIAVPNFLEAQVRAKVGRVLADMRTAATAIETYHVDHGDYPATDWKFNFWPPHPDAWETPKARFVNDYGVVWRVTTPISYLTSWPVDPFRMGTMTLEDGMYIDYYWYKNGRVPKGGTWPGGLLLLYPAMEYFMFSNGPDQQFQGGMEYSWNAHYDSSNGTISLGNIVRFGP